MQDISDLIREARPMYMARKRRRKVVKTTLAVMACSFMLAWFMPHSYQPYNEYDSWASEIAYIENGSVVADMGLPVDEYGLLWRLPLALAAAGLLVWILLKLLKIKTRPVQIAGRKKLWIAVVRIAIVLPIFFAFVRYGGAFNYAHSINWESAERLKSAFLNENILDDGQACYRVYKIWKEQQKLTNVNISPEEIRKDIMLLGGNPQADTIENAFKHGVSNNKPSYIRIRIMHDDKGVDCYIENSYFPKDKSDKSGSGIGLVNLKKRLDLIYPEKYLFIHEQKGDSYVADLYINIYTKEDETDVRDHR